MASGLPVRAAIISGVSPNFVSGAFGSAPALMSFSIISALPLVAASWSGVAPARVTADTFAPARISRSAVSRSSQRTAQWRAVVPSTCAALTSAFFCSKERIACLFSVIAASAISLLDAPNAPAESNIAAQHHSTRCVNMVGSFRETFFAQGIYLDLEQTSITVVAKMTTKMSENRWPAYAGIHHLSLLKTLFAEHVRTSQARRK